MASLLDKIEKLILFWPFLMHFALVVSLLANKEKTNIIFFIFGLFCCIFPFSFQCYWTRKKNTFFLPCHLLVVVNVLCTLFFVCLFWGGVGEWLWSWCSMTEIYNILGQNFLLVDLQTLLL